MNYYSYQGPSYETSDTMHVYNVCEKRVFYVNYL